jgi:hypothetical protein
MFKSGHEIIVHPPELIPPASPDSETTIQVLFSQAGSEERLFFRFHGVQPIQRPELDALLPLILIPAMKLRSPLRFAGPVSRQILDGARRFQEIFTVWYPEFHPVAIHPDAAESLKPPATSPCAGVFFSGGLDSSYSLIKHQRELTHAIFVHGCDIPLENMAYRKTTISRLKETTAAFGIQLVEIETNLRDFSNQFCDWGLHYHGAALAAMTHLLGGLLGKVYIASSTSYERIIPWGSSMVTDPLWTTPHTEIIYDGAEHPRLAKIPTVAQFPVALRNLRVCFGTPVDGYNCGSCEKCYRTMVALRICGVLENCTAFDKPLDLGAMRNHPEAISKFFKLQSWTWNHRKALEMGNDPELIEALNDLHRKGSYLSLVQTFSMHKKDIMASPFWRKSLPKFRTALLKSLREEDPEWWKKKILAWLPTVRNEAFTDLAAHDRRWFNRMFWQMKRSRWLSRIGLRKRK